MKGLVRGREDINLLLFKNKTTAPIENILEQ